MMGIYNKSTRAILTLLDVGKDKPWECRRHIFSLRRRRLLRSIVEPSFSSFSFVQEGKVPRPPRPIQFRPSHLELRNYRRKWLQ